jgi:hypothetical protein
MIRDYIMQTKLKLKNDLPYNDGRNALSGMVVEPLVMSASGRILIGLDKKVHWIHRSDISEKIHNIDEGDRAFDGEIANKIEKLAAIENPSPELQEAVALLKSVEQGMEYIFSRGLVSVRRMAKIMNCYIEDITKGL